MESIDKSQFKEEIFASCDEPNAIIVDVAKKYGLNADRVHDWWFRERIRREVVKVLAKLEKRISASHSESPSAVDPLRREEATTETLSVWVHTKAMTLDIRYPISASEEVSKLIKELLSHSNATGFG